MDLPGPLDLQVSPEGPNHEPVKEIPLGNRQSTCHSQVEA